MKNSAFWVPGEQATNPLSQRRASGAVIINGEHVADTLQCVHCGIHWIPVKNSKKIRGYCESCKGSHCGKIRCWTCTPYKKKVELRQSLYM